MCLAVPGKIVGVKGDLATVDYEVEKRTGKILTPDFKKGDYVIIQGGIVVMKIPEKEAQRALALYKKSVTEG